MAAELSNTLEHTPLCIMRVTARRGFAGSPRPDPGSHTLLACVSGDSGPLCVESKSNNTLFVIVGIHQRRLLPIAIV